MNKNLAGPKILLNFAAANGAPPRRKLREHIETITIDKSSTRAVFPLGKTPQVNSLIRERDPRATGKRNKDCLAF